jgi:glycosyltransferase involved in cell wall biosynthesis
VFPDRVHGGSQKILADVVRHLGGAGHTVQVFCTSRPDNLQPFDLAPNVHVSPTLGFKPTYPEPYYTPPFRLADIVQQLSKALDNADVFYIHDGELLYHFLYREVPTVVSFRDFIYPDTLAGALSFRRDALILNSDYVAGCVVDTFSSFCRDVGQRIAVIPNGVDLDMFRPGRRNEIQKLVSVPNDAITLLYPHRPDPQKGIFECLEVLAMLRDRLKRTGRVLRLLIPVWMDGDITKDSDHVYQTVYERIRERSEVLGISDLVVFHQWIPQALMPAYYALGTVTLCIGTFVEAFGNVALESAACGTRPIVARVAAHRTVLPDAVTTKVPALDLDAVADAIENATECPYPVVSVRELLAREYSYDTMLRSYESVITTTRLTSPLPEDCRRYHTDDEMIQMPTWCHYDATRGYYNDYLHDYSRDQTILGLFARETLPATASQLIERGLSRVELNRLLEEGMLVRHIRRP